MISTTCATMYMMGRMVLVRQSACSKSRKKVLMRSRDTRPGTRLSPEIGGSNLEDDMDSDSLIKSVVQSMHYDCTYTPVHANYCQMASANVDLSQVCPNPKVSKTAHELPRIPSNPRICPLNQFPSSTLTSNTLPASSFTSSIPANPSFIASTVSSLNPSRPLE